VSAAAADNLIPPSIGFILYGIASDTSIVKLFAAGVVPGLLLAAFFGVYIWWYTGRSQEGRGAPFSLREFLAATRDGIWSLAAPIAVLGGIYAGLFSPTEAAGIACLYALFVVGVLYREIGWKEIWESASRSMYLTAQVLVIVAAAGVFSWLLTTNGVPQALVSSVTDLKVPPWAVLLAINVFLLLIGMALDTTSSILVLTPLLVPVARAMGVDPVHFGVILVFNLSIGTFTPPFGINLFVGQAVFRLPIAEICRGTIPFIGIAVLALMVVTYIPSLSLAILRLLG
jgi:C4-dicarboxylate transporter, DctM subunit